MMNDDLGRRIRQRREALELSRRELGEKAGISALTILRVEFGYQEPRLPTLEKLAQGLGVRVADLWVADDRQETETMDNETTAGRR